MRREKDRLEDILEAIGDVEEFVAEYDAESFAASPQDDRKTFRAVMACLSAIGEAVKGLPDELRGRHPNVDWKGFAGLRDIVAHQYFRVHPEFVWKTIADELPALKAAAETEIRILALPPP